MRHDSFSSHELVRSVPRSCALKLHVSAAKRWQVIAAGVSRRKPCPYPQFQFAPPRPVPVGRRFGCARETPRSTETGSAGAKLLVLSHCSFQTSFHRGRLGGVKMWVRTSSCESGKTRSHARQSVGVATFTAEDLGPGGQATRAQGICPTVARPGG